MRFWTIILSFPRKRNHDFDRIRMTGAAALPRHFPYEEKMTRHFSDGAAVINRDPHNTFNEILTDRFEYSRTDRCFLFLPVCEVL
jgi:hypothetical protein